MQGLDNLNLRLSYAGGNQEGRMQADKLKSLKKALLYSYQAATAILQDGREFKCLINPDKNSSKIKDIYIYPFRRLITNNKYKKLKIDLALEIKFSKLAPEESTYPFIQFICTNLEKRVKNTSYINSSLNISKKDLIKNKYNFIRIEKEFNIEGQSNVELEIRLQKVFNEFLDGISPNNLKTTIKNINVEVSAY